MWILWKRNKKKWVNDIIWNAIWKLLHHTNNFNVENQNKHYNYVDNMICLKYLGRDYVQNVWASQK